MRIKLTEGSKLGFVRAILGISHMRRTHFFAAALVTASVLVTPAAYGQDGPLWIDFNSTTQDNGPHPHPEYQSYDAGHEVAADFVTRDYEAFSSTVSFTPSWPDSTANTVMQAIDRGSQAVDEDGFKVVGSHDLTWFAADPPSFPEGDDILAEEDTTNSIDLVTDWIGVDTRTGNGGNGDFDGEVGDPTRMLFTLSGVPAGEYNWISFHHDTEFMHGSFWFDYSTDGGSTFEPVGDREFRMTKSNPSASNPPADEDYFFGGFDLDTLEPLDLNDLPSTINFDFTATGDDVVLQFTPLSADAVHTQFVGVNGFQLTQTGPPTNMCNPNSLGDLDGDGEVAFPDFLILSGNFGTMVSGTHTTGDIDCDGEVAFPDFLILSGNFGMTIGAAESVPEPSGLALFGCSSLFLGLLRRRRN